jgi:hypothetical protein
VTYSFALFSQSQSCFFINAGISQSSQELSGARNASLLRSTGCSTFDDVNPPSFTTLENPSVHPFLIGSHRVFTITPFLLLEACSLNHVAIIVTFTSSSKESSNDIPQIIFASGSRIS